MFQNVLLLADLRERFARSATPVWMKVGLVAATRRILVLTAEFGSLPDRREAYFRTSMIELAVLTGMIVAFVASLLMLRNRGPNAVAHRV